MSIITIIIIVIAVGSIASGILLLKQSAKKFDLTKEQLTKIKERNEELDKESEQENK